MSCARPCRRLTTPSGCTLPEAATAHLEYDTHRAQHTSRPAATVAHRTAAWDGGTEGALLVVGVDGVGGLRSLAVGDIGYRGGLAGGAGGAGGGGCRLKLVQQTRVRAQLVDDRVRVALMRARLLSELFGAARSVLPRLGGALEVKLGGDEALVAHGAHRHACTGSFVCLALSVQG